MQATLIPLLDQGFRRLCAGPRFGLPRRGAVFVLAALALGLQACAGRSSATKPGARAPDGPLLAVVAERGASSELRLYSPQDGRLKRVVATVQHRQGWGLRASAAPDGHAIAYVVLPREAQDPDSQGELWLLPLSGKQARRLATGVDLRSELVWSPDSAWVSYDKVDAAGIDLRRVNASGAGDERLVLSPASDRWYVMGYGGDGHTLALAHLSSSGTEVIETTPGAASSPGTVAASSASRGFTISPDGRPALLAFTSESGRTVYRALVRAEGGAFARMTAGGDEDTGIAWNPRTGRAMVGIVLGATGEPAAAADGIDVLLPPSGFDVPVRWSADGAYLALRHFSGASTDQPGSESPIILSAGRRLAPDTTDAVTIIGWTVSPG